MSGQVGQVQHTLGGGGVDFVSMGMGKKAGGDPGAVLTHHLFPRVSSTRTSNLKNKTSLYTSHQNPSNRHQINTAIMVKAGTYYTLPFHPTGPLGAEGGLE
jgi:hypothetical protein